MSTERSSDASTPASAKGQPTKLVSLLVLAGGTATLPQTGNADVIVTDLSSNPARIGYLSSSFYLINNLPGTAQMAFQFGLHGSLSTESRWVLAGQAAGYVRLKTSALLVMHVPAGMTWNGVGGVQKAFGTVASAFYFQHFPNAYDHQYMLFRFQDSTQGNALRYGWAELSVANGDLYFSEGPEVTLWRYAYDNTGASLATGEIPEPGSTSLLALGALVLGAKGVRSWRNRHAPNPNEK
jgi:hypothetical protein